MKDTLVKKYARALVEVGVNLQPGETVVLQADTESLPLAREITKVSYEKGARDVQVRIDDPWIEHERIQGTAAEELGEEPEWEKESLDYYLRREKRVQIGIHSSHPDLNSDCDPASLQAYFKAKNDLRNVIRNYIHKGTLKWTGSCWPCREWAEKVYPELSSDEALEQLEKDLCAFMHVSEDTDPVEEWHKHLDTLADRSHKLNSYQFDRVHITSELGTDIEIGLIKNHIWVSAGEMGSTNVSEPYVANMPSYEVFNAPNWRRVNGIAYASFPLLMSGKLVKDFWIRFEEGRAVECGASQNVDALEAALFRNENTRHLGEVALVSKRSPIKQTGRIFYNGLIDENAACHLAFGSSFPDCVQGGTDMTEEELYALGVNFAVSHNDFMIGTDDTKIAGICEDGTEVVIMEHGDFVI